MPRVSTSVYFACIHNPIHLTSNRSSASPRQASCKPCQRSSQLTLTCSYLWGANLVKLSIALFYLRIIARTAKPLLRWTIIATAVFAFAQALGFCLALLLICRPLAALWLRLNPIWAVRNDYTCGDPDTAIHLPVSVLGLATDLWLAVLPALFLSQLQMARRQKLALVAVFALGLM